MPNIINGSCLCTNLEGFNREFNDLVGFTAPYFSAKGPFEKDKASTKEAVTRRLLISAIWAQVIGGFIPAIRELTMMNIRLIASHGLFSLTILKANFLFWKIIIIGFGSQMLAVIWPRGVYSYLNVYENLKNCMGQLLALIPVDLETLCHSCNCKIELLQEWKQKLASWREELIQIIACFADSHFSPSCQHPYYFYFEPSAFQNCLRKLLLCHYERSFVDEVIPMEAFLPENNSESWCSHARDFYCDFETKYDGIVPEWHWNLTVADYKFHRIIINALRESIHQLQRENIYTKDEITPMICNEGLDRPDPFTAAQLRAIVKIAQRTYLRKDKILAITDGLYEDLHIQPPEDQIPSLFQKYLFVPLSQLQKQLANFTELQYKDLNCLIDKKGKCKASDFSPVVAEAFRLICNLHIQPAFPNNQILSLKERLLVPIWQLQKLLANFTKQQYKDLYRLINKEGKCRASDFSPEVAEAWRLICELQLQPAFPIPSLQERLYVPLGQLQTELANFTKKQYEDLYLLINRKERCKASDFSVEVGKAWRLLGELHIIISQRSFYAPISFKDGLSEFFLTYQQA